MKTETQKQTKSAAKNAIALNAEIVESLHDANNVLTTSNRVHPLMQGHYTNMETSEHGITALIKEILIANDCVNPACIVNKGDKAHYTDKINAFSPIHEFRKIAIAQSMFTIDILTEVQNRFTGGTSRYPKETVETYLSVWMIRSGVVGKIKLTKHEDNSNRPKNWSKPRNKWFIIAGME